MVVIAAFSLFFAAEMAEAQATIAKPDVAAAGSFDGDVDFTWGTDPTVEYWAVAVVNGVCAELDADSTTEQNQVTCIPNPAPSGPLCVSVKGYGAADSTSAFSNWRCVDGDAFGFDDTGASYVPTRFALGRVASGSPLETGWPNAGDCIVDLSFVPYRYVCVDGESDLDTLVAGLSAVAETSNRVFWIGNHGDVVVEDYGPVKLVADLALEDNLDEAVLAENTRLQTTYTVRSQFWTTSELAVAPSVGVTLPISSGFDLATVEVADGCVLILQDVRCYLGDIDVQAERSFTVAGLPTANATAAQFEVVAVIDTDIPGIGESVEGENAGVAAGGESDGFGTNGRSHRTSATIDFGASPGVSSGSGTGLGGPFDGGNAGGTGGFDGIPEGTPACFGCAPSWKPTLEATSGGDPHIRTFDGVRLQFHAAGDFVLARSTTSPLEIHVRFGRFGPPQISWNWGLAMRVGDSVLTFGDDESLNLWDDTVVKLDGAVVAPSVGLQDLPGGATLRIRAGDSRARYEVLWPDGTHLTVGGRVGDAWRLRAGDDLLGTAEGLAGNADGSPNGDLVAANGATYDFDSLERYTVFGDSWGLDAGSSMFLTELEGDRLLPEIPLARFSLSELAAAALAEAEAACRAAGFVENEGLAQCIFDLAVTGDQRLIEGSRLMQSLLGESISALALLGAVEDDTSVVAPAVLVGEISTSHKIDVFRFDLESGASVTIDSATSCTDPSSFEFVLEAPSGEVVARNGYSRTTQCGRIGLFDLPETGEYKLRVYDSFGVTGQYALAVALPGSNASVYVLDDVASGSVDAGGEQFHIFEVAQDGTEVFFQSQGCGTGNRWQLIDPDLTVVQSRECFQDFTEFLDAGQWTIRYYSDDTRAGSYSLRAWEIPERQSFGYALDDVGAGSLSFPTDRHRYVFDVGADGTEVFFESRGCASGLRWRLLNQDGSPQSFENCFEHFSRTLDAGSWTVEVYSADDRFGSYSFRLWEIPERQSFGYALDDVGAGSLSFPTDRHRYVFDVGADGTEVFFESRGCASGLRWRLLNQDGSPQSFENCFEHFSRTLDAGSWTVEVYSADDRFGSYSFRLWEIPERQNFDYVIGDVVDVSLTFPTDSQNFSFEVGADGTTLLFDGRGCSPTSLRWQLRRPDGSLVINRYCFQDFTQTLDAGVYTVRVYVPEEEFGTFRFQVSEQ